jgi:hypothetical protein
MPNFDCEYTVDPICPYCGETQSDAWELNLDSDGEETETDCDSCGLPISVTVSMSIRYSTKPVDPSAIREYCVSNDLEIPDCVKS